MVSTERKWYVIRVISGKEAKVKEYIEAELRQDRKLAENVFEIYCLQNHVLLCVMGNVW